MNVRRDAKRLLRGRLMIDQILSLAFSMQANPGTYALLLGSGVSRSAGIPTGWEVVLDLIRKLARLQGDDCEPNPAAWYVERFDEEPDYARLLEAIAKSPAERHQLLRSYFEPTQEELEQGLKVPTDAHTGIAELVAGKYVRVIVTTNFDRLLEKAMEQLGVVPTVISTPDAVEGSLPVTHTACTIIKVHGDYLDTRIKNTAKELDQYDERMVRLLDRVFDEFGVVICGWSAEWDSALRAAIERCRSRRFTTFWTVRGKPGDVAKKLIDLRDAQVIQIESADSFFRELAEKVYALQGLSEPHPLSTKVAVAILKRYLVDDRYRIRLHDLVMAEAERLFSEVSDDNFPVQGVPFSPEELVSRVRRYEGLTETLEALMITGCYWGDDAHQGSWVRALERVANPAGGSGGLIAWLKLRRYPALLLLYAGGLAAVAGGRYRTLAALLTKATVREENRAHPLVLVVNTADVIPHEVGQHLPGMERHFTPVSDHLFSVLREPLREYLPDDTQYQKCFDRFEYLLALVHADLYEKLGHGIWGPIGCFGWRGRHLREFGPEAIMSEIESEAAADGDSWAPLQAGFFDRSMERFNRIKQEFDNRIKGLNWW